MSEITRLAFEAEFGSSPEVALLERLRASSADMIELVIEDEGDLVGHIAATSERDAADGQRFYCLGPMAVAPGQQGRGIGRSLVLELLPRLWARGATGVVLVGHPGFYSKCGFEPAARLGFTIDFEVPSEVFMVALNPDASVLEPRHVAYPQPFFEM